MLTATWKGSIALLKGEKIINVLSTLRNQPIRSIMSIKLYLFSWNNQRINDLFVFIRSISCTYDTGMLLFLGPIFAGHAQCFSSIFLLFLSQNIPERLHRGTVNHNYCHIPKCLQGWSLSAQCVGQSSCRVRWRQLTGSWEKQIYLELKAVGRRWWLLPYDSDRSRHLVNIFGKIRFL